MYVITVIVVYLRTVVCRQVSGKWERIKSTIFKALDGDQSDSPQSMHQTQSAKLPLSTIHLQHTIPTPPPSTIFRLSLRGTSKITQTPQLLTRTHTHNTLNNEDQNRNFVNNMNKNRWFFFLLFSHITDTWVPTQSLPVHKCAR